MPTDDSARSLNESVAKIAEALNGPFESLEDVLFKDLGGKVHNVHLCGSLDDIASAIKEHAASQQAIANAINRLADTYAGGKGIHALPVRDK